MFKLRNRDSEARQALCPPRLAGHGPDEAGHTGHFAAGCFRTPGRPVSEWLA